MKAPKILPWIARKAGLSDELALKLWRRAAGEAEMATGNIDTADYYRLAVERFINFVEAESGMPIRHEELSSPCYWVWRHQTHMSQLSLAAAHSTYRLWQANWQNFLKPLKRAA